MNQVYTSAFLRAFYDDEKALMKVEWQPTTTKMTDELFKNEVIQYAKAIERYKPDRLLTNMKDFGYTIPRETQVWADELTSQIFEDYILREAIVVNEEYEELFLSEDEKEYENVGFDFEYFDDEIGAMAWLNLN